MTLATGMKAPMPLAATGVVVMAVGLALGAMSQPGHGQDGAAQRRPRQARSQRQVQPRSQPQLRPSQVLATYEDGKITVGDLEKHMGIDLQQMIGSQYISRESFRGMLKKLVDETLLASEAKRRGFAYDAEVLKVTKKQAVDLFVRERFEDPEGSDSISSEEVETYYQQHLDEFHRPLSRRASQIVVRTREKAAAILKEAEKLDMTRFRELVARHSVDQESKKRGGDLRYFDPGGRAVPLTTERVEERSVEPAVAEAVFALKGLKLVPEPVRVKNGWAVVRMTGERPEYVHDFTRVAHQIRARLLEQRKQNRIDAYLARVRREVRCEVHPKLVDALKLDALAQP